MLPGQSLRTDPIVSVAARCDDRANDRHELQHITQLTARMHEIAAASGDLRQTLVGCLQLQLAREAVVGTFMLRHDGEQGLAVAMPAFSEAGFDQDQLSQWLLPRAARAIKDHSLLTVVNHDRQVECITVPLRLMGMCGVVVVLRSPLTHEQRKLELCLAQLAASFLDGIQGRDQLKTVSKQLNASAVTLELVQRIQHVTTVDLACLQIVTNLQQHLKCERVFIGLEDGRQGCRIRAVSDVASVDPHADLTMAMKAVLDECIARDQCGSWPPLPGSNSHQLLAHKMLAKRDALVLSTPLKSMDGQAVGALAIVGSREMASVPNLRNYVHAFGEPLGSTLRVVQQQQGGGIRRACSMVLANSHRTKRIAAVAFLSLVMMLMVLPWSYTVRCRSTIEPMERRFCVAPHDGLLETTLAEPGDMVTDGQLLAWMDGRQTRWELAGVTAEKHRAAKERDSHLARQETAEALMSDFELKRLENQQSLLQFRESNLQIGSPIDGIVLSGSLDRRENYPVTKGQVLYEIAPLSALRIEIHIPADEVMHVNVGDGVRMLIDGFGTEWFKGRIARIRPRSEIREQENVFVAEVLIDNTERKLRPGMRGIAKVETGDRMIGWILFHRAWEHVCVATPFL